MEILIDEKIIQRSVFFLKIIHIKDPEENNRD